METLKCHSMVITMGIRSVWDLRDMFRHVDISMINTHIGVSGISRPWEASATSHYVPDPY